MKSGLKAMCIAVSLIATSACIPATAAPAVVKNDTAQQHNDKTPVTPVTAAKPSDADDGVVSINTGSAEALAQAMNGVGLKKAQSIVSYREEYGPFKALEQLQEVPGIGSALVERNLPHIKL
ncbi:competence protein ComEA [Buttiauxella sp. B2]|uniref:helix-hairpin-helix domain-containing protein n=1 Tax=Buttiauxella sp. B2 TaxID=2587812 RepID=UPI001120B468|nr:helix-hairpin-helix domain-containing protein [Buttiauxella sp. B2]TNV20767.1 competence protein ComEA [Buttiauxella sp. B2]